ncbi:MAG TPA: histidine phosphatase family protein [Holophagaceae bacterium]|nr:histidine phosphatase family protein [Holophagaceae bacterium]
MTTLLLIRHGIAEDWAPGRPDAERALTAEGWEKTRAAMRGLVRMGHVPDRGISSPYRRALETMACLKEAAQSTASGTGFPVGVWDGFTPEGDVHAAEAWLRILMRGAGEDERIAVTSHQPFLADLIAHLTGRDVEVRKASCTVVEWMGNGWRFKNHYSPSQLRGE